MFCKKMIRNGPKLKFFGKILGNQRFREVLGNFGPKLKFFGKILGESEVLGSFEKFYEVLGKFGKYWEVWEFLGSHKFGKLEDFRMHCATYI